MRCIRCCIISNLHTPYIYFDAPTPAQVPGSILLFIGGGRLFNAHPENNLANPIFGRKRSSETKNANMSAIIKIVRSEGLEHSNLKPKKLNLIFSSLLRGFVFVSGIVCRLCIRSLCPLKAF